ncbi:MAG TPA: hypothetical protein VM577_05950, partial [Anaerovoracaceae bacterium]|nr:hypothetical protein [Anaerovoracaceae bacterium]
NEISKLGLTSTHHSFATTLTRLKGYLMNRPAPLLALPGKQRTFGNSGCVLLACEATRRRFRAFFIHR